jgi:glycosyltransferase involved in cell wall biosynthesis
MTVLSIVIPLRDEEENIKPLHSRLKEVLPNCPQPVEVVFVNDGSTDRTQQEIEQVCETDARFGYVQLRRNLGKSAAYMVGFQHVYGEFVATMDGDLQDDPADILKLLDAMTPQTHLVSGWKYRGKGAMDRALPSRFFNWTVRRMTGMTLHDFNCPLKIYRRVVVSELALYGELYRFIPVLAHNRGFNITEVPVENYPRRHGRSKFGIWRLVRGYLDLITVLFLTRYNESPLYVFGFIGSILFGLGFLLDLVITLHGIFGTGRVGNFAALLLGVLMMMIGIQLFATGLVADLVISRAVRPDYPIQKVHSRCENDQ